jgi:hypothetical protein
MQQYMLKQYDRGSSERFIVLHSQLVLLMEVHMELQRTPAACALQGGQAPAAAAGKAVVAETEQAGVPCLLLHVVCQVLNRHQGVCECLSEWGMPA